MGDFFDAWCQRLAGRQVESRAVTIARLTHATHLEILNIYEVRLKIFQGLFCHYNFLNGSIILVDKILIKSLLTSI